MRWLPAARRCIPTPRATPVTLAYLLVLVATTVTQVVVSAATRHHLLAGSSTDVVHLRHDPLLALLASAFWVPDRASVALLVPTFAVLAAGERRFGSVGVVVLFVTGHVVATLATELPVWLAVHESWIGPQHARRVDVGGSYGAHAVFAALAVRSPRATRRWWIAFLVAVVALPLVLDEEVTTVGHAIAAAVGAALALTWRRLDRSPDEDQPVTPATSSSAAA